MQHPTAGGNPAADKGWFINTGLPASIYAKYDCSAASAILKGCFLALLANCKPPNVSFRL
jgi:hypothetical protein